MAYIKVEEGVPGIRSLALFRPETAKPLYELAQVLLRGESPLSEAEREIVAAYVSYRNECVFCWSSHAAAARCLYGEEARLVDEVLKDMQASGVSEVLKALLVIAGKVQVLGNQVTEQDISNARALGATDRAIHDTVLIAASFSMFNRYVDGLGSFTPTDPAVYAEMGKRMAKGYVSPSDSTGNKQTAPQTP
ncbi:MAG TPA: peroxidase-related enzyme [Chitinophagaceae bacterium]